MQQLSTPHPLLSLHPFHVISPQAHQAFSLQNGNTGRGSLCINPRPLMLFILSKKGNHQPHVQPRDHERLLTASWPWFCGQGHRVGSFCIPPPPSPWRELGTAACCVVLAACHGCDWSAVRSAPSVDKVSPFCPPCVCRPFTSVNQAVKSASQSIDQSICQLRRQSHQPVSQSTHQSVSQTVSQLTRLSDQSVSHSAILHQQSVSPVISPVIHQSSRSTGQSLTQPSINQSNNQSVQQISQSVNQSVYQPSSPVSRQASKLSFCRPVPTH